MKANNEEIYGAIEHRRWESPEILLLGRFLESNRCHMNYLRLETSITAIVLKIRDIWYLYLRIYLGISCDSRNRYLWITEFPVLRRMWETREFIASFVTLFSTSLSAITTNFCIFRCNPVKRYSKGVLQPKRTCDFEKILPTDRTDSQPR